MKIPMWILDKNAYFYHYDWKLAVKSMFIDISCLRKSIMVKESLILSMPKSSILVIYAINKTCV